METKSGRNVWRLNSRARNQSNSQKSFEAGAQHEAPKLSVRKKQPSHKVKDKAEDLSEQGSNKERKPSSHGKESNSEIMKHRSNDSGLLVPVTDLAKDVEKKVLNLTDQDEMQSLAEDGTGENSFPQSVRRKQKNQASQIMQTDTYDLENSATAEYTSELVLRKQQNQLQSSMQLCSFQEQVHSSHGYYPVTIQPVHNFVHPMLLPDSDVVYIPSIEPLHHERFNDNRLQEIHSSTNISTFWPSQLSLGLSGLRTEVEKPVQIISNMVCQKWIFDSLNHEVLEAREIFPELEIRFDRDNICLVGHPSAVEQVHNMLNENVKNFLELVLDVPKECHGLIIGKKGQKIDSLHSKYKVSICIPSSDAEESRIRIRGRTSDVKNCESEILNLVQEFKQSVKILSFPNWLYSHLETYVKEGKAKWQVKAKTSSNRITLTGSRSKVELFYIFLEEKILEMRKMLSCECIKAQESHCKYIFGDKMKKKKKLAKRFQVSQPEH